VYYILCIINIKILFQGAFEPPRYNWNSVESGAKHHVTLIKGRLKIQKAYSVSVNRRVELRNTNLSIAFLIFWFTHKIKDLHRKLKIEEHKPH
jgi:hypothetical protein